MALFLERRSYRMRRMMDAVRLLPFLGLALWMAPLMWQTPDASADPADAVPMSRALIYVFGVWFFLIVATLALWRRTRDAPEDDGAR